MNDSPTPDMSSAPRPSSDAQTISEIRAAVESLRGVFQVVALSGIVLSAALMMFLYQQSTVLRRQNDDAKAYIMDFNTNLLTRIEMSRTNLEAFARTNASIAPIMKKYFATNVPPSIPPPPSAKP